MRRVENFSLIRGLVKESEALAKVPGDTDLLTLIEIGHGVHYNYLQCRTYLVNTALE